MVAIGVLTIGRPCMRMAELPGHDMPQDLRPLPVEGLHQRLPLGLWFEIKAGLPVDTLLSVARPWVSRRHH